MIQMFFPKDFLWGTATASYQVEGASLEDGKGESIWDRFSHISGNVLNDDTGDIACDQYHKYKDDIKLMKALGLKGYRFSIAWPRIYKEGWGRVNPKGVDFYNYFVDELLKNGIEPVITLYHWDLPQALQDRGGWENRDTIEYYSEYAAFMFNALGDRVKKWITHNEPWVASFLGNAEGVHAPGFKNLKLAVQISHNLILSHAKAIQVYRQLNMDGIIGIALNLSPVYPASNSRENIEAAFLADGYYNRWFLDPVLKGNYPVDILKIYENNLNAPIIQNGDMKLIASYSADFLGINYYSRAVVQKSNKNEMLKFEVIRPMGSKYTEMNWEIYPEGLYDLLTRISKEYESPHIYITENGAAFKDKKIINGIIQDDDRLEYFKLHFAQAYRAIEDGVKLDGYLIWSLMDNFEWALGYTKRFGIINVDFKTLERKFKKSALWYKDVISNNGIK